LISLLLWLQAVLNTFDGIIDTVSAQHDISTLLPLLKTNGKLILLGVPPAPHSFGAGSLLFKRCNSAACLFIPLVSAYSCSFSVLAGSPTAFPGHAILFLSF
jgi:hypothetical protein